MIIEEHKAVFVHIPKNAGTSVKNLFSEKLERPFQNKTIDEIKSYMDINNQEMGKNVYMSQLIEKVNNVGGVLNVIDISLLAVPSPYCKPDPNSLVIGPPSAEVPS